MFQQSVGEADPAAWRKAAGDASWRVRMPALLRPAAVTAMREDVVAAARRSGAGSFGFLHGTAALPAPVVCRSVDRHADLLYDLAREPSLLGLAESLVGKAVVPLRGDYVLWPPTPRPTAWRQAHGDYVEHFGDEPAALVWLPLRHDDAAAGRIEFAAHPGGVLLASAEVEDPRLARHLREQDHEPQQVAEVPAGGCVAFDSHAVWRFGANAGPGLVEGALLHYRGSPYREARRDGR